MQMFNKKTLTTTRLSGISPATGAAPAGIVPCSNTVKCQVTELVFDAEKPVVFGDPVGS